MKDASSGDKTIQMLTTSPFESPVGRVSRGDTTQ